MKKLLLATVATTVLLGLAGTTQSADKKTLAFVVNGASDFWKAAEAGVKKAQGELPNYTLTFKYPEQSSAAIQTRIMDDLVAAGVPLEGAADHGVSEALYLRDPDGNGLELYRDRPREEWPRDASGGLLMVTEPLDLSDLLAEATV